MGAILEATPAMSPWWAVEMRSVESAYVTTPKYVEASNRLHLGKGQPTDEERAWAWQVDSDRYTVPGPPAAFAAALEQISGHPAYADWRRRAEPSASDATAELLDGKLVLTMPGAHAYGRDADGGHVAEVEILYRDVAALQAAVAALA
ncbi:hypothetical protein ABZ499_32890 [Streptomyces sp. NPDC019990]|uniref:hypothetical protein n=1 Tax=Streptomyces sp. NPDC019990 TaxID=3154693 RepID=UPI0033DDF781